MCLRYVVVLRVLGQNGNTEFYLWRSPVCGPRPNPFSDNEDEWLWCQNPEHAVVVTDKATALDFAQKIAESHRDPGIAPHVRTLMDPRVFDQPHDDNAAFDTGEGVQYVVRQAPPGARNANR